MATSQNLDQVNCSICLERYRNPKSLPCLHTFCETCLDSYINNLEEKGELKDSLECPVCRKTTCAPAEDVPPKKWAKHFPYNYALKHLLDSGKKRNTNTVCDSCKYDDLSVIAEVFCKNCGEFLCKECKQFHQRNKLLKSHIVVPVQDYRETEDVLINFSVHQTCGSHQEEKLKYYCKDDCVLCCSTCAIINHWKCHSIVELKDVAQEFRKSQQPKFLAQKITCMQDYVDKLQCGVAENFKDFENKVSELPKNAQSVRENVMTVLDAFEEHVLAESKAILKTESIEVTDRLNNYKRLYASIASSLRLLESAIDKASEQELFTIVKKIEDQTEEYKTQIEKGASAAEHLSLKIELDGHLQALQQANSPCCKIAVSKKKVNLPPLHVPAVRASPQSIVKFDKEIKVDVHSNAQLRGATVLPNHNVILVDWLFHKLYMCGPEMNQFSVYSTDTYPIKAVALSHNQVIVNFQFTNYIKRLSFSNDKLLEGKKIGGIKHKCLCIAGIADNLLALSYESVYSTFAFGTMTLDGVEKSYLEKDSTGRKFKSFYDFALNNSKSKVLQCCKEENAVFCFSLDGEPHFTYKHKDLQYPRGIAVDKTDNIYVCGYKSHNIHQLAPSGKHIQIITTENFREPCAIWFGLSGDGFFVTSLEDNSRNIIYKFALTYM